MLGNLFISKGIVKLGVITVYISCAYAFIIRNSIIANSTSDDELSLMFDNTTDNSTMTNLTDLL